MTSGLVRCLRNAVVFGSVPTRTHVIFLRRGKIFVDRLDNRGQSVLRNAGATQPIISLVWRALARRIRPEIVLDIGANYGEIALSLKYMGTTRVHLFEPNPHVRKYLDRSVSTHANRANITVHREVASDCAGFVEFVIDRKWSGTSSVIGEIEDAGFKGGGEQSYERLNAPTITIDQCIDSASNKRVLFKIDVEGYEDQVIRGMELTLERSASFAGIVEYDRQSLLRANTDPDAFVAGLRRKAKVRVLAKGEISDTQVLPEHCDLVVASDESYFEGLGRTALLRGGRFTRSK